MWSMLADPIFAGLESKPEHAVATAYPNPFSDKIYLKLDHEVNGIWLSDLRGALTSLPIPQPGERIDLSPYFQEASAGCYFLRVLSDRGLEIVPLVKLP
jgi:hypothetical protein